MPKATSSIFEKTEKQIDKYVSDPKAKGYYTNAEGDLAHHGEKIDSYVGDTGLGGSKPCSGGVSSLAAKLIPQEINIMEPPDRATIQEISLNTEVIKMAQQLAEYRYLSLVYLRELQLSNRACAKKARYIKKLHSAIRDNFDVSDVRDIFKQAKNGS